MVKLRANPNNYESLYKGNETSCVFHTTVNLLQTRNRKHKKNNAIKLPFLFKSLLTIYFCR